jgi:hypothetical protein
MKHKILFAISDLSNIWSEILAPLPPFAGWILVGWIFTYLVFKDQIAEERTLVILVIGPILGFFALFLWLGVKVHNLITGDALEDIASFLKTIVIIVIALLAAIYVIY